jgi:hypothetical protein
MVSEFDVEPGDRSTANYDAVNARLNPEGNPPAGLIVHTAGFAGDVFRVFDIWESQADAERFLEERLMPAIQAVMSEAGEEGAPPARQYFYALHDLVKR